MPAFPELHAPLSDGVVALRVAAERDIPETLIAHQDDPGLFMRLGMERPPSGAQLGSDAEQLRAAWREGRHFTLTILEPGADVCVGQLYGFDAHWRHMRVELGIWLAPQVRGRRLAPRALLLAAGWLAEQGGFERFQLLTELDNEAMLGAARAAGFRDEGILRGYTRERGSRVDLSILGLLASDLPTP